VSGPAHGQQEACCHRSCTPGVACPFAWSSGLARLRRKGKGSLDDALASVQRRLERKAAGESTDEHGVVRPDSAERPGYFRLSRSISAGFIASLPLLTIYEAGILGNGDINAMAQVVKTPIAWFRHNPIQIIGTDPIVILNGVLIVAALVALVRLWSRGGLHPGTFCGMFVESAAYALLLGPAAIFLMTGVVHRIGFEPHLQDFRLKLVASCGAGLYEELIFRAVFLGSLYTIAKDGVGLQPLTAGAVGLLASAAMFSAAHFIFPGEPIQTGPFVYRLLAGVLLGIIFLARGFGIAAWTHALYDLYVLCFLPIS